MPELTQAQLNGLLHYDPSTGIWRWRVSPNPRVKVGDIAAENTEWIGLNRYLYSKAKLAQIYLHGGVYTTRAKRTKKRSLTPWPQSRHGQSPAMHGQTKRTLNLSTSPNYNAPPNYNAIAHRLKQLGLTQQQVNKHIAGLRNAKAGPPTEYRATKHRQRYYNVSK
jgi:hypothetical protein